MYHQEGCGCCFLVERAKNKFFDGYKMSQQCQCIALSTKKQCGRRQKDRFCHHHKNCPEASIVPKTSVPKTSVPKTSVPKTSVPKTSDSPARGISRRGQTSKSSPPKVPTLKRVSPSPKPSLPRVRVSSSPLKRISPKKSQSPKKAPYSAELMMAINKNDIKTVKDLLTAGVDPNSVSSIGLTALGYAVDRVYIEIIKLLLEYGADPNKYSFGKSVLMCAIPGGNIELVKLLLEYGADPNVVAKDGHTPLTTWKERELFPVITKLLLDAGANPNLMNGNGVFPLIFACRSVNYGRLERSVELLLTAGADPNVVDWNGDTPLWIAYTARQYDSVKLLLSAGTDPNMSHHDQLLINSISTKNAELLLLAGAKPTGHESPEVKQVIEKLISTHGSLQEAHEHWKQNILPEWTKWKLAIPGRNVKAAGRR